MLDRAHIALNAHLLSGEASYRSAGIHGYLFNTLAHLPDRDPELAYTVFVGPGHLPERSDWAVRRSRLPTHSPTLRILWEQCIAPLALEQIQPDLLHGMAFSTPLLWGGASLVTIYDLSFLHHPGHLGTGRRLYLGLIVRASARRARRVIAISESGKREIGSTLGIPLSRIDVATPGVGADFQPLPEAQVADFRVRNHLPDRFILCLGTLEPRKNLETLLRAYACIPQRDTVKLVLAGGVGWKTRQLFTLIGELDLERDVILPGYVPGDSLAMWYNSAEIFVYPSLYEGFGLPVLEAMACGTPVVASNTTSLPEAVGPGGILLPPMDVDAWASTLTKLLDRAVLCTELGARGREWAAHFTWEKTAQKTVESYRRALGIARDE